jgi:hypothetical protein
VLAAFNGGREKNTRSGHIWMDDVGCSSSESQLNSCRFDGWGSHDCGHDEDVGVCCNCDSGSSRLFSLGGRHRVPCQGDAEEEAVTDLSCEYLNCIKTLVSVSTPDKSQVLKHFDYSRVPGH